VKPSLFPGFTVGQNRASASLSGGGKPTGPAGTAAGAGEGLARARVALTKAIDKGGPRTVRAACARARGPFRHARLGDGRPKVALDG